jgi:Tfp pilus assembly protein PilF
LADFFRRRRRGAGDVDEHVHQSVDLRCTRLANLAHPAGDKQKVVRERSAIVALGPADKADAYYQLALAQHEAGDDVHARKSVLRSLEEAPNFEPAQMLLLTIYDARAGQPPEKTP